jgi:cell division septation protein DedD
MTQSNHDDSFREIQLSGKQLVFLFMATTVVSVVIFLCGVMVGRGARIERAGEGAETAITSPTPAPADSTQASPRPVSSEPPSPPADDELSYAKRLEGDGAPPEQLNRQAAARPEPKAESPAPAPPTSSVEEPKPEPAKPAAPRPEPARAAAAAPAPAGTAGRPGRWVVQLVALRDQGAATSIVQKLSGKGYPAFITPDSSSSNRLFKVQVGRYDDRREAEQVARRLEKEEKFNPWISR